MCRGSRRPSAGGSAVAAELSPSPLRVDLARLAKAPAELQAQLRADPFTYFRFVNTEWAGRVCEAFQRDLPSLPTAILHGDAHVEQYALTRLEIGFESFLASAWPSFAADGAGGAAGGGACSSSPAAGMDNASRPIIARAPLFS